jgi:protein-tyrosine phosphatase
MMTDVALTLDGVHNIRDLGGLPMDRGGQTAAGRVLRGCAMTGLTAQGRAALLARGLATVIDLRSPAETAAAPVPFAGMPEVTVVQVPLFADLAPVSAMAADPGFRLEHRYTAALETAAPRFAAVFAGIAGAAPGALIFHCTAGKDRTGLIAALLLRLAGVPAAAVITDYARTATDGAALIATLRARALDRGEAPERLETVLSSPPSAMEQTLAALESRHGGARAYLVAAGLDAGTLDRAAARLHS